MKKRIFFDGLNLALEQGTGIATYTRVLAKLTRDLGNEVGVLYSSRRAPAKDPIMREIGFFDERRANRSSPAVEAWNFAVDHVRCLFPPQTVGVDLNGVVVARQFDTRLPRLDHVFLARNVFQNSHYRFDSIGQFATLDFAVRPDIFHCTYQLPLRAKSACNVYTIHDLVPLRLPFATLDNKRRTYRLLKKIAAEADHIVTVSENSRRDIIELLGVEEKRVTNTYEAVEFPAEYVARTDAVVSEQLSGSFGLEHRGYLLFYGAFEPKKNVSRLIDAYLASGVDIPFVMVTSQGWENEAEAKVLAERREKQRDSDMAGALIKRRVIRFEYVSLSMLVTLIKGARAVVFPSLYEGFGLPVLEAMALGTPVLTSRESSLPEIAGDAALLVDPYETDEIARAITTITADADLRAELVRRGHAQAELFSLARYSERIEKLYDNIG